jgi:hypothetical protein
VLEEWYSIESGCSGCGKEGCRSVVVKVVEEVVVVVVNAHMNVCCQQISCFYVPSFSFLLALVPSSFVVCLTEGGAFSRAIS